MDQNMEQLVVSYHLPNLKVNVRLLATLSPNGSIWKLEMNDDICPVNIDKVPPDELEAIKQLAWEKSENYYG